MLSKGDIKGLFKREGVHASIAQRLALGFMVPALALGALSRRRWQEDKDEMAWDMFWYPMQQMPIFGSTLVYGLSSGWRDISVEPVPLVVVNDLIRIGIDFSNTISEGTEFGYQQRRNAIEAFSVIASFPTAYAEFAHVVIGEAMRKGGWDKVNADDIRRGLGLEVKD
jgi:hypothetical protein